MRKNKKHPQKNTVWGCKIEKLYFVDIDVTIENGIDREGGERFDASLLLDVLAMGDDRGETDAELVCYLLVGQSLDEKLEYLNLAER